MSTVYTIVTMAVRRTKQKYLKEMIRESHQPLFSGDQTKDCGLPNPLEEVEGPDRGRLGSKRKGMILKIWGMTVNEQVILMIRMDQTAEQTWWISSWEMMNRYLVCPASSRQRSRHPYHPRDSHHREAKVRRSA
jgi:hypothetical protein